jgi:hypothetical protein
MVEYADRLVTALQAPYPGRFLKLVRAAMTSSDSPSEQVQTVATVVADLRLEPISPPELLPEIDHDDVHPVCSWAIVPASDTGSPTATGAKQ